ncbi:MAG: DNA primase, partial [Alistipes sp.]|nr:DNA primase [Alistipes sp.]
EVVPLQRFVHHSDPEVVNVAVEISTAGEIYVMSELWKRKDVHVESDEEMLSAGVPKTLTIYKSKVVDRLIREQQLRLQNEGLSEAESEEALRKISQLNKIRLAMATKTNRLIM